jgi:23S rRNA pseudouridine1911/1915/1917 synthase
MEFQYTNQESIRVDKFLTSCYEQYTRSYIQKIIQDGLVSIEGKAIKANHQLKTGDIIHIDNIEPKPLDVKPSEMPLDIIYEDDDLLVINKERGVVVHPAPGNYENTLVNGIMYHCKNRLSTINGVIRPGIVHRIDKDTTGLLVICKTDLAHQSIAAQLKDHSSHRLYEAIVYNNIIHDEGMIDAPIGRSPHDRKKMAINERSGKEARTHYQVIERLDQNQYTYVALTLETGRTHQIRVHMTSIGNPLVGDPVYGPSKSPFAKKGQMLHAKELGFIHPTTHEFMKFSVDPPDDFQHILEILRKR